MVCKGTIVNAIIIEASSSTKNATGMRDPEMHQAKKGNQWHIAMMPAKLRQLGDSALDQMRETYKRAKVSLRACVEHPFWVIKRQFGCMKARYRSLAKSIAPLKMLFTLTNLWKVRHHLIATAG